LWYDISTHIKQQLHMLREIVYSTQKIHVYLINILDLTHGIMNRIHNK